MRKAVVALTILLSIVVVAQFFFAAVGAFDDAPTADSFGVHRALGYVVFGLPIVLAAVAAVARAPRRLVVLAVTVAGLTAAQVLIAKLAEGLGTDTRGGQLVFGLHALGGLAILLTVGLAVRRASAWARPPRRSGDDAPDSARAVAPPR